MDDTDVIEIKRARAPGEPAPGSSGPPRRFGDAPSKTSPEEEKIEWCSGFVLLVHPVEALDAPHPDSGVHGHLWRVELSSCLLDPQEYERQIVEQMNNANTEKR